MTLLCGQHHRTVHREGWQIRIRNGRAESFPRRGWTRPNPPTQHPAHPPDSPTPANDRQLRPASRRPSLTPWICDDVEPGCACNHDIARIPREPDGARMKRLRLDRIAILDYDPAWPLLFGEQRSGSRRFCNRGSSVRSSTLAVRPCRAYRRSRSSTCWPRARLRPVRGHASAAGGGGLALGA